MSPLMLVLMLLIIVFLVPYGPVYGRFGYGGLSLGGVLLVVLLLLLLLGRL